MCEIIDYLYMCTNWLSIICSSIAVDYIHMFYPCVLYMYKWIYATYYVKGMGHSEGFSNLTMVANVLMFISTNVD